MRTMAALVKNGRRVSVQPVPLPSLTARDDVLLRVVMAGICRTDVYVAQGRIPCREPLILGHEFSAVVHAVGPGVRSVRPGDRVTAMPLIACGACGECRAGASEQCQRRRMLGVERDGVFAEFIAVPAATLYRLPEALSFKLGAYIEPIAASLAVLKAGLPPRGHGLLYGSNRIALLTQKILAAHGFADITLYDPEASAAELGAGEYDFVIETVATTDSLHEIVRAVRPRGIVVLKSRPYQPAGLDVRAAVLKELTFRAVNYGSFDAAIALVAEGRIDVSDLLGPVYPLAEFEPVFTTSAASEAAKSFLALADEAWLPA